MTNKKPTAMQHCDKCHALVIFELGTMDEYTTTTIKNDKLHIAFHCPDCIKKYGIITDAQRDPFDEATESEIYESFKKEFDYDCYDLSCEARDCCECETFQECYEEYRQALGYTPRIGVDE